jgi:predicted transcriptional regulator
MRTTETMTISLPPAMARQLEKVRKQEHRTRSELMREALRHYFDSRVPEVTPTRAEMAAIRRGRAAFKRGEYISLEQLLHDLDSSSHQAGGKGPSKVNRAGSGARESRSAGNAG